MPHCIKGLSVALHGSIPTLGPMETFVSGPGFLCPSRWVPHLDPPINFYGKELPFVFVTRKNNTRCFIKGAFLPAPYKGKLPSAEGREGQPWDEGRPTTGQSPALSPGERALRAWAWGRVGTKHL